LLHQINQALKEVNRITGLHVARVQVQHEHRTVADLITSASEEGYWDIINGDNENVEVAEYEIVEEN
jgi:hypothetical protein